MQSGQAPVRCPDGARATPEWPPKTTGKLRRYKAISKVGINIAGSTMIAAAAKHHCRQEFFLLPAIDTRGATMRESSGCFITGFCTQVCLLHDPGDDLVAQALHAASFLPKRRVPRSQCRLSCREISLAFCLERALCKPVNTPSEAAFRALQFNRRLSCASYGWIANPSTLQQQHVKSDRIISGPRTRKENL